MNMFGNAIITGMTILAVFMAMLSLLSSVSSSYLERIKETATLHVLGLYGSESRVIFRKEATIHLVSSGISGSISGYMLAAVVFYVVNLFFQIPGAFVFPWYVVLSTFAISYIMLRVGIWFLFRVFHKRKSMAELLKLMGE